MKIIARFQSMADEDPEEKYVKLKTSILTYVGPDQPPMGNGTTAHHRNVVYFCMPWLKIELLNINLLINLYIYIYIIFITMFRD